MGSGPFTNKTGDHYLVLPLTYCTGKGVSFGNPFENYATETRLVGTASKAEPVKSDHHAPTSWGRGWTNLINETPSIGEYRLYDWVTSRYESYISLGRNSNIFYTPSLGERVANAKAMSTTKALAKLNENNTTLGADLAEAVRMNDFVAETVGTAARTVINFKRGNWKAIAADFGGSGSFRRRSKEVSSRWLEFIYGVTPLMQSAHDTANTLFQMQKAKPMTVYSHGSGSDGTEYKYIDRGVSWSEKTRITTKTRLSASVTCPFVSSLAQLGIINPASIAWELVPFSFVVDWFVPVGNYLEAWSAIAGLSFNAGTTTTKIFSGIDGEALPFGYEDFYRVVEIQRGTYHGNRVSWGREVHYHAPLPEIYTKGSPFSTTHVINALALIRQLF